VEFKTAQLNIRIPEELLHRLQDFCYRTHKSQSVVVRDLLEAMLAVEQKRPLKPRRDPYDHAIGGSRDDEPEPVDDNSAPDPDQDPFEAAKNQWKRTR
jgi:hypothetical protein